jgi:hypothetical protein
VRASPLRVTTIRGQWGHAPPRQSTTPLGVILYSSKHGRRSFLSTRFTSFRLGRWLRLYCVVGPQNVATKRKSACGLCVRRIVELIVNHSIYINKGGGSGIPFSASSVPDGLSWARSPDHLKCDRRWWHMTGDRPGASSMYGRNVL